MDSDNKRKYLPGILIMTLIFLGLSIFSVYNMINKNQKDDEEQKPKGSYISLLEENLNITLDSEDDFENFNMVGYDLLVEPTKYRNYFKPCFDFLIAKDGVIVKNSLSKEFYKYPLSIGSKIVKIDDKEITGLGYFEIFDLIYSSTNNVSKTFVLSDGTTFIYNYKDYSRKEDVVIDGKTITMKLYNLDNITRKGIYDKVVGYDEIILDLSSATVTDFETIRGFVSFFSNEEEVLFVEPQNVKGLSSYKLNNVKIILGDNKDLGISFLATTIKKLNASVTFDRVDLSTTSYMCGNIISNADYTIKIYNYELVTQKPLGEGVVL